MRQISSTTPTYQQPVCPGKIADYRLKLLIKPLHAEWVAKNYSAPFSLHTVLSQESHCHEGGPRHWEYDNMVCLEMAEELTCLLKHHSAAFEYAKEICDNLQGTN
jgi:hypothetical protein